MLEKVFLQMEASDGLLIKMNTGILSVEMCLCMRRRLFCPFPHNNIYITKI